MSLQRPGKEERLAGDPDLIYGEPAAVLADGELTDEERLTILQRWEFDLTRRLASADENMREDEDDSHEPVAQLLRRVQEACRDLARP